MEVSSLVISLARPAVPVLEHIAVCSDLPLTKKGKGYACPQKLTSMRLIFFQIAGMPNMRSRGPESDSKPAPWTALENMKKALSVTVIDKDLPRGHLYSTKVIM